MSQYGALTSPFHLPHAALVTKQWMIYGAYGFTGALIARDAVRCGERPLLAGRSEARLAPLAEELGLEHCAFSLEQARQSISGVRVLLNCAGPFSATAKPLVDACLHHHVHYVDITGEIPVFQFCHSRDAQAKQAGVILCPGAGFDVVPTDCLAALLKEELPDSSSINLAFRSGSRLSHGTTKRLIEGLGTGGMIRRNHDLVPVPSGYRVRRIAFRKRRRWTVTIPWGDVFTAGVSTGVPNRMVYSSAPLLVGIAMRAMNPLRGILATNLTQTWLRGVVEQRFAGGPDEQSRRRKRAAVWGEAKNDRGHRVVARLTTPNPYTLTADTALGIAMHCLDRSDTAGYVTPSILMGSRFILSRPGIEFEPPRREDALD